MTRIDEGSDGAAFHNVKAPTLECKSVVREIPEWKSQFDLALEPSSYGLRIVGIDVRYLARQQRALVSINNRRCESGLVVLLSAERRGDPPYDKCDKQESGSSSHRNDKSEGGAGGG